MPPYQDLKSRSGLQHVLVAAAAVLQQGRLERKVGGSTSSRAGF